MKSPVSIQSNREFSLNGVVVESDRQINFTKLIITCFDYAKEASNNNEFDQFEIYFSGEAKNFVDMNIERDCFIFVRGELRKSTKHPEKIILVGKYVQAFMVKNSVPEIRYVNPDDSKDVAY